MKLDALLANMKDFDYICDESVTLGKRQYYWSGLHSNHCP